MTLVSALVALSLAGFTGIVAAEGLTCQKPSLSIARRQGV
jgi:hypothetical protein